MGHPVEQVWLFGSYARDEACEASDIDILYVSEKSCPETVLSIIDGRGFPKERIDLSHYTRKGLVEVLSRGSLFGWHLKEEGRPLFEATSWLSSLLTKLPGYRRHKEDLNVLRSLVTEIRDSLVESGDTKVFDAGVLSTAIRNTGIIMTDFLGSKDFSPDAPKLLESLENSLKMPISNSVYEVLLRCRHVSERGACFKEEHLALDCLGGYVESVSNWQKECLNFVERNGGRYAF